MKRLKLALLLIRHPRPIEPLYNNYFLLLARFLAGAHIGLFMSIALAQMMMPQGSALGEGLFPEILPLASAALIASSLIALYQLLASARLWPSISPTLRAKMLWTAPLSTLAAATFTALLLGVFLYASKGPTEAPWASLAFLTLSLFFLFVFFASSYYLEEAKLFSVFPYGGADTLKQTQIKSLARIERQRLLMSCEKGQNSGLRRPTQSEAKKNKPARRL